MERYNQTLKTMLKKFVAANEKHNHRNQAAGKVAGALEVVRRMGPATYEINLPGMRKSRETFHINLLKEWNERPPELELRAQAVIEEAQCPEQFFPPGQQAGIPDLSHLTSSQ